MCFIPGSLFLSVWPGYLVRCTFYDVLPTKQPLDLHIMKCLLLLSDKETQCEVWETSQSHLTIGDTKAVHKHVRCFTSLNELISLMLCVSV